MNTRIESTARKMADEIGLINITKSELCRRAEIPEGSFHQITGLSFVNYITSFKGEYPTTVGDVTRGRATSTLRKPHILASAVCLAAEQGYNLITRADVAAAAGVSPSLVTKYFATMGDLRDAIMTAAIEKDIPRVIAQGLAAQDPIALAASDALKRRAADTLTES